MKLVELKTLLKNNGDKQFQIQLPSQNQIPISFHVTEVGQINKTFIDCGGKVHSSQTCQLQIWVGEDEDHRINAGKLASILELARAIVPSDEIELEIEYEDAVISQYPVAEYSVGEDAVTLHLATKHTDCLAKELCLVPSSCSPSSNGAGACC